MLSLLPLIVPVSLDGASLELCLGGGVGGSELDVDVENVVGDGDGVIEDGDATTSGELVSLDEAPASCGGDGWPQPGQTDVSTSFTR